MAKYENTVPGFRDFLEEFSKLDMPNDETPLPFRLQSSTVVEFEIKGELMNWVFAILESQFCPDFLKFQIANEVANTVFSNGIEQYQNKIDENDDDVVKPPRDLTFYSSAAVARATCLAVHSVCTKWHEELPDFKIPLLNRYSVCGIKNTRRKMEDKHTVITSLNALLDLKDIPPTQFYGVYDGHGGLDASAYVSKHLHIKVVQQKEFKTDLATALEKSVLELDNIYCDKSLRDNLRSGTTAVVAVIRENVLHVAWIGDSQTVLVRDGQPVQLMDPHKPNRDDEKKRIEDLGGCVIWFGAWRVNGTLSVSRAIGDPEFKPFVSGNADTSTTEMTGEEDYLCVACDGFWDVFDGQQLAKLVSDHMKETGDKDSLSRYLCDKAKEAGSTDNITVLIVFLRDEIKILSEEECNKQETVETEDKLDNEEERSKEGQKPEGDNNENDKTSDDVGTKPETEDTVMVHGNKLQPTVKERPPHKLFINKPQNVNTKISVLVTDSAPHSKLPHSVVSHKAHWSKAPFERLDTRGSLLSLSTIESEEITMPLTLGGNQENRLSVNSIHGSPNSLPAIGNPRKDRSPIRNSPSPSCMSEPALSCDGVSVVHYPTKPTAQRQSRARKPYRTSVIMNQVTAEDGYEANSWHRPRLTRRASRSVPEHLNRYSKSTHNDLWLEQQARKMMGRNPHGLHLQGYYTLSRNFDRSQKENAVPYGIGNRSLLLDTDIAITNSLYNKIKPKKSKEKRFSPPSPNKEPLLLLNRRRKFQHM